MPNDFLFSVGTKLASAKHSSAAEHFPCQTIFIRTWHRTFFLIFSLTRTHRARPGIQLYIVYILFYIGFIQFDTALYAV